MTTRKTAVKSTQTTTKPSKKAAGKKAPSKATSKPSAQSPQASRSTAKKSSGGRKYSPEASKNVEREMREMKEGKLTIGRSGKKVKNPKQAIAIGLAEARRAGKKVPPNPNE